MASVIEDVAGVIFWTDNFAEMVRFYEHALGLAGTLDMKTVWHSRCAPGCALAWVCTRACTGSLGTRTG